MSGDIKLPGNSKSMLLSNRSMLTHYSGVQERGRFLRGYFNLTFRRDGNRTVVSHTEGILSAIPCLAWIAGFVYFRIIARGGVEEELGRLRCLIENR
jgi:hypothetical protein